jgi:hypothetical protein
MITRYEDKLSIPKNIYTTDKEKFEKYIEKAYAAINGATSIRNFP